MFCENVLSKLRDSFFVFKEGRAIYGVDRLGKMVAIPTYETFSQFIKENFAGLFCEVKEEDGFELDDKMLAKIEKQRKEALKELYHSLVLSNQFSRIERNVDPFAKENAIKRDDNTVIFTRGGLYIREIENLKIENYDLIIADYLSHFPQLEEIINWVVACRFNPARRSSYLYLRVSPGFGKSFFLETLEHIGMAVTVKQSQLKDTSTSELSPDMFINSMVLAIDEFTHFQQELKAMTNRMTLAAKYQMAERVELFAKIFLSAEKSSSFFGEAGVDKQLADRVNLIDLSSAGILIERELYKKQKEHYFEAVKQFIYRIMKREVAYYIGLGRFDASKKADEKMTQFQEKFKITANAEEKIIEAITETIGDYIDWAMDEDRPKNRDFEKLEQYLHVLSRSEVIIKSPTRAYEEIIGLRGEQFRKVAKFKQTALDEILGESKSHKIGGKVIRGIKFSTIREVPVQVDFKRADGTLSAKSEVMINIGGGELVAESEVPF